MTQARIRIYHNARCSKSRAACELLAQRGCEAEVVPYLDTPLSREDLVQLLDCLGMRPSELLRRGEAVFQAHFAERDLSEAECFEALLAHPILMERPILRVGDRAVIGRPPERVLELL